MLAHVESRHAIPDSLPRHASLIEMLNATVARVPRHAAVVCEGRTLDYAGLGRAVRGLARELRAAGATGGRVALMMPNGIEAVVASFAGMAVPAQLVPFNPFFTLPELAPVVQRAEPAALVCVSSTREKAQQVAAAAGVASVIEIDLPRIDAWAADAALDAHALPLPRTDDLALLAHTGGTTGIPKGVDHTHGSLLWQTWLHCAMWPLEYGTERFLSVAPMFHIWGLGYATLVPAYTGGTIVIVPKYEPAQVLQALADHAITVFGGGPAPIYIGLLAHPLIRELEFPQLRYSLSGGAPCSAELHRTWRELTGCELFEGWGMTEGAPFCLNPLLGERRPMSVGNPVPHTTVEVVDLEQGTQVLPLGERGELRVRGPQLMRGYRNAPEETANALRDGWMYTGDIGYADADGFLFLVDRKKDMVIVGGYNVYPREIDELLFRHPKILEAATVGRPDERLGEVLAAYVVLQQGESMSEQEFFDYCRDNLVKYKRPVEVHFVGVLPRTPTNKIDRRALRANS